MRADQQRVRSLLSEAITLLCKNTLSYTDEFCVEGLLGITLDNKEVFLVNIKENVKDPSSADTGADPELSALQGHLQNVPDTSNNYTDYPSLLGINQQSVISPQQPTYPVPTSRPIASRSPYISRRSSFGSRGRLRGKRQTRPSFTITSDELSPSKRPRADEALSQTVILDSGSKEGKTDDGDRTSGQNAEDPLTTLDFASMIQEYKDSTEATNDSTAKPEEDTFLTNTSHVGEDSHQNQTLENSDKTDNGDIVIKPEPPDEDDSSHVDSNVESSQGGSVSIDSVDWISAAGSQNSAAAISIMPAAEGYTEWNRSSSRQTTRRKSSAHGDSQSPKSTGDRHNVDESLEVSYKVVRRILLSPGPAVIPADVRGIRIRGVQVTTAFVQSLMHCLGEQGLGRAENIPLTSRSQPSTIYLKGLPTKTCKEELKQNGVDLEEYENQFWMPIPKRSSLSLAFVLKHHPDAEVLKQTLESMDPNFPR